MSYSYLVIIHHVWSLTSFVLENYNMVMAIGQNYILPLDDWGNKRPELMHLLV